LRDLGALYSQAGEGAKARAALERAASLNPQDAETHFQLSRLYNRLGEAALAARHLEQFQKLKSQREQAPAP
jgi:Flp pilus assembly protein TadD